MLFLESSPLLAILLSVPLSSALAAVNSQLRWDLSLRIEDPSRKSDEDAVDQSLNDGQVDNDEAAKSRTLSWKDFMLVLVAIALVCCLFAWAAILLPSRYQTAVIVLLQALAVVGRIACKMGSTAHT